MKKIFPILLLIFITQQLLAQKNILHYSETSGFDHNTRDNSFAMFLRFANTNNYTIINDNTGNAFDDLDSLLTFDLIIFSNTSGDAILNEQQQQNFEVYIQNGGALLGLHSASDTYRHSTANGTKTGTWDFYPETLGGSVQENPNHVSGTPAYNIFTLKNHPSVEALPKPWLKNEEYYYWENGYLNLDNEVLLKVEETLGPNGMVNSYDSSRAVSWFRILDRGSKVFYTSLGHSNENFNPGTLFERHLIDAAKWLLNTFVGIETIVGKSFTVWPNPANNVLRLEFGALFLTKNLRIYNQKGDLQYEQMLDTKLLKLDVNQFTPGLYFIEIGGIVRKILIE